MDWLGQVGTMAGGSFLVAVSDGSAYGASDPWPKLDEPPEVK